VSCDTTGVKVPDAKQPDAADHTRARAAAGSCSSGDVAGASSRNAICSYQYAAGASSRGARSSTVATRSARAVAPSAAARSAIVEKEVPAAINESQSVMKVSTQ
jgi:hypothetical protein